jgi:hypothetical protein
MKLPQEHQALLDAAEREPALKLMVEITHRNVAGARENLEALMDALEIYFDGDIQAAIEAARSGAIAFELAAGGSSRC